MEVTQGEAAFSTGEDVVRDPKTLNELKDRKVQFTEGCLVTSAQERRAVAPKDCNMHDGNCSLLLSTQPLAIASATLQAEELHSSVNSLEPTMERISSMVLDKPMKRGVFAARTQSTLMRRPPLMKGPISDYRWESNVVPENRNWKF